MATKILVTGGTGYIAMHVINILLKDGHMVRSTVRSLKDEKKIEPIKKLAHNSKHPLELVEADLLNAASWESAVKDMDYVLHVASPLPVETVTDEQLVIKPAVEGTLNVLNAAFNEKKVKRVVVTSSGLAIFGFSWENKVYSEADWASADKMPTAYGKSKVLAERAAWDFVEEKKKLNQKCFELAVVHPVLVLGPTLSPTVGSSVNHFLGILNNTKGKVPSMSYPCCDVRVSVKLKKGIFFKF